MHQALLVVEPGETGVGFRLGGPVMCLNGPLIGRNCC